MLANPVFIPPRTRWELANPAAPGTRHQQMIKLSLPLLGAGLSPQSVFTELRARYDASVADREIQDVVAWATQKQPQACTPRSRGRYYNSPLVRPVPAVTRESARQAAEKFLHGIRIEEVDLWESSPCRPMEDKRVDPIQLFAGLFQAGERVNLCTEHGVGWTKTREEWMAFFRDRGVPSGSIGCLFRPNPVTAQPTGEKGGYTDHDVTAFRYALIESDLLPLDLQLSVLGRLPLPIVAIIFSGGKSYHGLVQVNAADAAEYGREVNRLLALLRPLGFDGNTRNPSRMARLPGARRGDGMQSLIYLNPGICNETPIFGGAQ